MPVGKAPIAHVRAFTSGIGPDGPYKTQTFLTHAREDHQASPESVGAFFI